MQRKKLFVVSILVVIAVAVVVLLNTNGKPVKIDEWSSNLVAGEIEWAEVSVGYGIAQQSYTISVNEYNELITLIETVTEDVCSRKRPKDINKTDYDLAFRYDQKLWLFQCYDNGIIGLTFEDEKIAEHYGCENSLLYIDSPELWEYIINTVDSKAKK